MRKITYAFGLAAVMALTIGAYSATPPQMECCGTPGNPAMACCAHNAGMQCCHFSKPTGLRHQ